MAVAYDSVGPAGGGGYGVAGSSFSATWTHTTIAASTTILVAVSPDNYNPVAACTVTCDSVSMSALTTPIASGSGGTTGYLQVFSISGIAAGAHTIAVTVVTGGGTPSDITGGSVAYSGVSGLGTPSTSSTSASGSNVTATVASNTSGNIISGFAAAGDTFTQASGNATGRVLNNLEGGSGASTGNIAIADAPATGSSVTITWPNSSTVAATLAIEVQGGPVSNPGPPLNQGSPPNRPAIIVTHAGWRSGSHSR